MEQKQGDRLVIKDGFSGTTLPIHIYEQHLKRTYTTNNKISRENNRIITQAIKNRQQRLDAFHTQVKRYLFRDICTKSSIIKFVEEGEILCTKSQLFPANTKATLEERLAHLQNVVKLLKQYDNYQLALLDDDQNHMISSLFWEVKGDHTLIMTTWCPNGKGQEIEVGLLITGPPIVAAFRKYFLTELWDRISAKNMDKKYVMYFLENKIERLKIQLSRKAFHEYLQQTIN